MPIFDTYPQLNAVRDLAIKKKRRIFLVGGLIRDYHLDKLGSDFDFAVDKDAIVFARAFAVKIKGAFVLLDQEHGSARLAKSSLIVRPRKSVKS